MTDIELESIGYWEFDFAQCAWCSTVLDEVR